MNEEWKMTSRVGCSYAAGKSLRDSKVESSSGKMLQRSRKGKQGLTEGKEG